LARLPFKIKSRIVKKLHVIQRNPDDPSIYAEKIKGGVGFRIRVGPYRIIYVCHEDQFIIEVVKIRPRGDVYKG